MKRYVATLIVTLLVGSSQGAAADESAIAPLPNSFGDLPTMEMPEEEVPAAGSVGSIPDGGANAAGAREVIPAPGLDANDDDETPPFIPGETVRMLEVCPAVTESSGSWLRRGFWYTELDLVVTNRMWNADGLVLMEETTDIRRDTLGRLLEPVTNSMFIDDSDPGAQGLPRLTLGRFLFRDSSNRDHSAEVTWFGGGEWTQQGRLDWTGGYVETRSSVAGTPSLVQFFGLQSPQLIDGSSPENTAPDPIPDALPVPGTNQFVNSGFVDLTRNPSFDFATSTNYRYDSHMDSIELNYAVEERMQRDRMILKPNGQWVRQATPTRTLGFSAGLRFVNFREALNWNATLPTIDSTSELPVGVSVDSATGDINGVPTDLRNGRYFVATDNNLIGTQLGFTALARDVAVEFGDRREGRRLLECHRSELVFHAPRKIVSISMSALGNDGIQCFEDKHVVAGR